MFLVLEAALMCCRNTVGSGCVAIPGILVLVVMVAVKLTVSAVTAML